MTTRDEKTGTVYLLVRWDTEPAVSGYWDAEPDGKPRCIETYPGSDSWRKGVAWAEARAPRVVLRLQGDEISYVTGQGFDALDPNRVEDESVRALDGPALAHVDLAIAALRRTDTRSTGSA